MSVKLQTEHITLSETICSQYSRITTECDVIVPDTKPDVLKILQISSEAVLIEKSVHAEKVMLNGTIRFDILYIPDSSETGNIKSISVNHEFSHNTEVPGAKPGMTVIAEVDCELPEYTLTNSRKLNILNGMGISIKITAEKDLHIATAVELNDEVLTRCEHIKICNTGCDTDRDMMFRERLETPSGKPPIGEILKLCVKPLPDELRILDNKAIAKGELCISTLYCGEDEENSLQNMEHRCPFTEILDIEGINENMTGEIEYCVKNITYEVVHDTDGDRRIINIEILLCANIRMTEIIECDAICDAYGLKKEIVPTASDYEIEKLLDNQTAHMSLCETVTVPDYLPELHQMFNCNAVPAIENISVENGKATVFGYINCNILYMSSDVRIPVSGFSHIISFNRCFDIPELCEYSICEAKADIDHLSYTLSDGRNIDIRPNLVITLKAVNAEKCKFISEIEFDDDKQPVPLPSMTVYFIRPGDTLWEIAKRYRTTTDSILENNNVDPHNLQVGSPIYIFR